MFSCREIPIVLVLIAARTGSGIAQPVPASPGAESNVPPSATPGLPNMSCGQVYSPKWDNCVGLAKYPNGNIYRGEFHHGAREGFGVIVIEAKGVSDQHNILSNEPSMYAGEFRNDRLNGHGVWFTKSGAAYSGTFVDNIPQSDLSRRNCNRDQSSLWSDCVATVSYGNGNLYRGEFVRGRREGVGLLEIRAIGAPDETSIRTPLPSVYVGEFKGDRLNGRGMIYIPNAGCYGIFTNNTLTRSSPTP
jgi:hypothetical protein